MSNPVVGSGDASRLFSLEEWSEANSCPVLLENVVLALPKVEQAADREACVSELSLRRILRAQPNPDYSTITDAGKDINKTVDGLLISEALTRLAINTTKFQKHLSRLQKEHTFSLESSAGPNGPAMWTAHVDAAAIVGNKALYEVIEKFSALQHVKWVKACIDNIANYPQPVTALGAPKKVRKLITIMDKAAKTRVVAVFDYFTQSLLSPIHLALQATLKAIPMDYHDNQDAGFEWALAKSKSSGFIASVDLKSATDRIPMSLQVRIVSLLTGSQAFADLWRKILVDFTFTAEDDTEKLYARGQPMGAKSSFMAMSLAHHVLVQLAAKDANKVGQFQGYAIVGDDIVLFDRDVYLKYVALLDSLDIPTSPAKTLIINEGQSQVFEFCKRIGRAGTELSPLPVNLIFKSMSDKDLLPNVQNEFKKKSLINEDKAFLRFLSGFASREGLINLLYMNGANNTLTGIHKPISDVPDKFKIAHWIDGQTCEDKYFKDVYVFAMLKSILTKADQLVTTSHSVLDTIMAVGKSVKSDVTEVRLENKTVKLLIAELEKRGLLDKLTKDHPVVRVAELEKARLVDLISRLQAADDNGLPAIRLEVLNMLRNSMLSAYLDPEVASARVGSSIFNMASDTLFQASEVQSSGALTFSIRVKTMEKVIILKYVFGGTTLISAMRPKVSTFYSATESLFSSITDATPKRYTSKRTGVL